MQHESCRYLFSSPLLHESNNKKALQTHRPEGHEHAEPRGKSGVEIPLHYLVDRHDDAQDGKWTKPGGVVPEQGKIHGNFLAEVVLTTARRSTTAGQTNGATR